MKLAGETIHELRAHQIEIEKQNEKLRGRYFEIYDLAPVGYLTLNEQGSILEANHCAAALLGLPAGDLIGRTLSVFLAVEDRDALFPAKKHLPEDCLNVRSHAQELRLQKHDGTLTWVRLDMSAAVEIEAGKTVFLVTLTDISPSKKLEDELRHSEEKFKAMFNDSRDGLLVADVENKKIVLHNKVICDLLGYSDVEMASLYATDIHPAGTLSSVMDGFERQSRGELKIIENLPMRRKDGSVFFAEVNTSPISVGGRKCLMGSFRDITERKRLLEEKAEMEQRYFQAQKMESIGRLAGGVAHDFNNKLTSIL
ncbi:MAG: PAS domain S-box protein, partial [Myxococcota bacterium]